MKVPAILQSSMRSAVGRLAILCCLLLLWQSCSTWTEEEKKRQSLPDFHFENIMGGTLQRSDLPAEQPATILFFDPDCSHCKMTVESIATKIDAFTAAKNTLVMISPADRAQVIPYLSEKHLFNHPSVRIGLCEPQEFLDTFGTTQLPTMLFYAADFDLKMAYKGAVDVPGIERALKAIDN